MRNGCFLEKEESKNLIEIQKTKKIAGRKINNLAGRKSDRGQRKEKEWQIIGIGKKKESRWGGTTAEKRIPVLAQTLDTMPITFAISGLQPSVK